MIHYEVFAIVDGRRTAIAMVKTLVPIRAGEGLSLGVGDEAQDYKVTDVGNWCEAHENHTYTVTHHVLFVEPE